MVRLELEEAHEELVPGRTPAYGQEVDELNEKACISPGALPHALDHAPQSGNKAIVPDAQERAGGNISDAGSFDHEHARFAIRKTPVPALVVLGDKAVLRCPPGDHCGDPGASAGGAGADGEGREQAACACLFGARPAGFGNGYLQGFRVLA